MLALRVNTHRPSWSDSLSLVADRDLLALVGNIGFSEITDGSPMQSCSVLPDDRAHLQRSVFECAGQDKRALTLCPRVGMQLFRVPYDPAV